LVDAEGKEKETAKEIGPETITELDETTHFRAPRFMANAGDNQLDITWGHADCIDSYIVKVCPKDGIYTDCPNNEPVVPQDNGNKMISHTISGLESCTEYDVHIIPVLEGKGEFTAHPETVTTTNGTPEAPDFDVVLKEGSSEATIKWKRVNCASAYKIYYKVEDGSETEDVEEALNSEQEKTFEENRPCQTYSYAVTTMVNDEESVRPEDDWKNIVMPPKTDLKPTLKMVTHDEGKVTLKINLADENKHCGIDKYEVVYSNDKPCCEGDCEIETKVFTPDELNNGDIVVNVTGDAEGTIFKARVLYKDHDEWSGQVEYGAEACDHTDPIGDGDKLPLIPIVVGVAVLALVVIVVTVLLVKRSRNRNFDPEKAENGTTTKNHQHQNLVNSDEEETQKLNEAHA
jgi:hypothetical protein